jgi:transporter family-2 protein
VTNIYVLVMVFAGACVAAQISMNAQFGNVAGSPLWAANVSFAVSMLAGLVGLALAIASGALSTPSPAIWSAPLWVWLGGLGGAIYVFLAAILAQRLGAALLSAAGIVGQLGAALLIDHYGWFAMPVSRISAIKVLGALMLVGGVVLIRR